jgi:TonB family protein
MKLLTFSEERVSRLDWIFGVTGSVLMHLCLVLVMVAWSLKGPMSQTSESLPYYEVDLVSPDAAPMPASPAKSEKAVSVEQSSASPAPRWSEGPVAPVRRIRLENLEKSPVEKGVEKLEASRRPRISRRSAASLDRSLDKLIPEPKRTRGGSRQAGGDGEASGSPGGRSSREDMVFRLYLPQIWKSITQQWTLPETLKGSTGLEATLILVVRRDGKILSHRFEKKSGNELYDQSLVRAIRKADPLPPFPDAYPADREEIGVRFRPEDLN